MYKVLGTLIIHLLTPEMKAYFPARESLYKNTSV